MFARTDLVNRYWADLADGQIKISSTWRVFEISSGDQGETTDYGESLQLTRFLPSSAGCARFIAGFELIVDSPHLRHVSAPLSRAGISILYQSSYFSDFLLVKESTFKRASEIFAEQGCECFPDSVVQRFYPWPASPSHFALIAVSCRSELTERAC